MAYSTDLHELIHSMNSAEKAYFKKYAYKKESLAKKAYMQLFDAISQQKDYDEDKLRLKFRGVKPISSFSAAKHQLYLMVLRNLTDFQSDKSIDAKLYQHLKEAQLLLLRGLDHQCEKKVRIAKKLALESDKWLFMPQIMYLESMLIPYGPENYEKRMSVLNEDAEVLEKLSNLTLYRKFYTNMTQITAEVGVSVRDEEGRNRIKAFLDSEELQSIETAHTFTAKFMLLSIRNSMHSSLWEFEKAYEASMGIRDLFNQYPEQKKLKPEYYIVALNNLLDDLLYASKVEAFDEIIEEQREFLNNQPDVQKVREGKTILEARILFKQLVCGEYEEALEQAVKMESLMTDILVQPALSVNLLYLIACAHFYNGKYNECHTRLVVLLQHEHLRIHKDFMGYSLLLNLLVHLELGNTEHLGYAMRSAHRFLYKEKLDHQVEKVVLDFLRKMMRSIPSQQEQLWNELESKLTELKKDPRERIAFAYLDIPSWLEKRRGLKKPDALTA